LTINQPFGFFQNTTNLEDANLSIFGLAGALLGTYKKGELEHQA
jgi:hypothetical protein